MTRTRVWKSNAAALALAAGAACATCAAMPSTVLAQERYTLEAGEWAQQTPPEPGTPEAELQAARTLLAEGHREAAQKRLKAWIRDHPQHPLLAEAYLVRGDARSARGRYYSALFDYEAVVRLFPGSDQFHTALEREYEIARLYTGGLNRHFLGMRLLPAEGEGEELLIRIQERAPGSEIGERASLRLADYYFNAGRMDLAADAYDLFLENYPQSQHREWSMLRLIQASLARFRGPEYDPTGLIDAAQRIRTYQEEYPAAADKLGAQALLTRIQESLALKELIAGGWYERRGKDVSAAYTYERLVRDYPQTAAAQIAIDRLDGIDVDLDVD